MSSKPKKAGNLVALGSAAVVAVYGAGFMRTAAAAERFAEQSDERVLSPEDAAAAQAAIQAAMQAAPSVLAVPDSHAAAAQQPLVSAPVKSLSIDTLNKADATIAKVDAKTKAGAASTRTQNVSVPVPPEVPTVNASMSAASAHVTATVASALPATVSAVPDVKPAAEKATTPVATLTVAVPAAAPVTPTPVIALAPAPAVAAPVTPPTAPVAPTSAEASVATPATSRLKDGEYTGYGTSRHGDVEVYLETTDGKITYVKISQCLTQYSCSWISDLPKQVLARQSARVDGVSGATQSANAFYYAVVQALAKAK